MLQRRSASKPAPINTLEEAERRGHKLTEDGIERVPAAAEQPTPAPDWSEAVFDRLATSRDRGPPLMRRPCGRAGRRPAALSD